MKTELNFTIPVDLLMAVINFSAVKDVRYYLVGVHVKHGMIEATNGHCAGRFTDERITVEGAVDAAGKPAEGFILSLAQAKELIKQWAGPGTVVCNGGISGTVVIDPVNGEYVDIDRAIPKEVSGECAQFDPELLMLFKRASKVFNEFGHIVVKYNGEIAPARVLMPGVPSFLGVIAPWRPE